VCEKKVTCLSSPHTAEVGCRPLGARKRGITWASTKRGHKARPARSRLVEVSARPNGWTSKRWGKGRGRGEAPAKRSERASKAGKAHALSPGSSRSQGCDPGRGNTRRLEEEGRAGWLCVWTDGLGCDDMARRLFPA